MDLHRTESVVTRLDVQCASALVVILARTSSNLQGLRVILASHLKLAAIERIGGAICKQQAIIVLARIRSLGVKRLNVENAASIDQHFLEHVVALEDGSIERAAFNRRLGVFDCRFFVALVGERDVGTVLDVQLSNCLIRLNIQRVRRFFGINLKARCIDSNKAVDIRILLKVEDGPRTIARNVDGKRSFTSIN